MKSALKSIAIAVKPVLLDNGEVIIPGHKLFATDLHGKCAFNQACHSFAEARGDLHVMEAIQSSLVGVCDRENPGSHTVLDLGSNIGQMTGFMRAMGCAVVAVDPQDEMNRYFTAMLMVNDWDVDGTVVHHPVYVGDTNGHINITRTLWAPGKR